jgi:hypothetical protein
LRKEQGELPTVARIATSMSSPKSQSKGYGTISDYDAESERSEEASLHGTDYEETNRTFHNGVSYDRARRRSFIEEDEDPLQIEPPTMKSNVEKPVTWMSLPRKSQLAILTIARLSEPLVQTSLRVGI